MAAGPSGMSWQLSQDSGGVNDGDVQHQEGGDWSGCQTAKLGRAKVPDPKFDYYSKLFTLTKKSFS